MGYHSFQDEDGIEYGSFEVFHFDPDTVGVFVDVDGEEYGPAEKGWYWQACFPGCLPDGEPSGPFKTEDEALADANA
jgi:hypothetical protein